MPDHSLENLLSMLEIHIQSVTLWEIGPNVLLDHPPLDEIVVHHMLEGEGWLEVEGSAPLRLRPGTVAIVPRGRRKRIAALRGRGGARAAGSLWRVTDDGRQIVDATGGAEPEIRLVCEILSPHHASSIGLFDNLIDPIAEDLSHLPTARAAADVALAECAAPRFGSQALIETSVRQCLILALRRHYERHGADSALFSPYRNPRLAGIAGTIVRAPGQVYSVDALSASVGMSRSAFIKKFAECFGRSPMEFVAAVRLEAGARLLRTSELPVKAVASLVGFASRSHFSRAFRARYGVDPSAYRAGRDDSQGERTRS
jgi:AraC-like DNA-binding protein